MAKSAPAKKPLGTKPASKTAKSKKANTALVSLAPTEVRMIPLSQLFYSPKNVRTVPVSEADDAELEDSIRENGLKQNLVAYTDGKDRFAVDAGGRRYKALKRLEQKGIIPADYLVPCLIEDESEATVTSTTENLQRVAMHPADEYSAFAKMIDEGRSEAAIALKFGKSVDEVRRRLKLARVAPEIFEQFRAGELDLKCVMAFTLTDDHSRQLTVWNAVKDAYSIQPHTIKRHLTETAYSANSSLGKFVGIEAYEAAGGFLLRDLFDDRESAHMENPDLAERLAVEKLQASAKEFEADWKWVEVHLEVDYGAFRSFGRVAPQEIEPDAELLNEQNTLLAREDELEELSDGRDWTEEERTELDAIEERLEEIEELTESSRPYSAEDRAIAGCVFAIGHDGALRIEKGLVRPEDIPAPPRADEEPEIDEDENGSNAPRAQVIAPTSMATVPASDPATVLRKADGISQSLADDLRTTRQHILRAHLAADFSVAFDAMLYALCEQALSSSYHNQALNISISPFLAQNRDKLYPETVAQRMLDALQQDLVLDWMDLDKPDDFRAMSALPIDDKQALFAWAIGYAIKPQLASDSRPSPIIEEIGARLNVDVAACWRPSASTYWGRVNKAHAIDIASKLLGDDYAEERNRERKGDIAAAMEASFAENAMEADGLDAATAAKTTTWLPDGMAFGEVGTIDEHADVKDGDSELSSAELGGNGETASVDQADDIPDFLKDDAA